MRYRISIRMIAFILVTFANIFGSLSVEKEMLFIRKTGKPVTETVQFTTMNPTDNFILRIQNGPTSYDRVSSATIVLNGVEIFRQSDFNQQVEWLEKPVTLQAFNTIAVTLASKPKSALKILVCRNTEPAEPRIAIIAPLDNSIIYSNRPTISIVYSTTTCTSHGHGEHHDGHCSSGHNDGSCPADHHDKDRCSHDHQDGHDWDKSHDDHCSVHHDDHAGSLKVLVNGVDRTRFFTVTDTTAQWSIPAGKELAEGLNTVKAYIGCGCQKDSAVSRFTVCTAQPPVVVISSPANGDLTNQTPIDVS